MPISPIPLSDRQRAILALIAKYLNAPDKGYAPSFRQMVAEGISPSTSVVRHNVLILERRGYLVIPRDAHDAQMAHTMHLTEAGRVYLANHNGRPADSSERKRV